MTRRSVITVIGKSAKDPRDPVPPKALAFATEVGALVAERGGLVIGILPGFDKRDANEYVDIALTTGMGWMRNTLTVRAADAVIMISGGIGTLNELTVAYELKPTVVLEGTGGWASRMREVTYEGKHLDEGRIAELHYAQTPREAVDMAFALAARGETGRDSAREYS